MNTKNDINYDGWELKYFDLSKNFRKYQFDLIKRYISGNVAEIGPGNGIMLEYYLDRCETLDLFEPDKDLFFSLNNKFTNSKKIFIQNKELELSNEKYNTILYLDVLEHIKDHEKEILKAFDSLKDNGYLVINVPAFQFLYSDFDKNVGHYRRYSKHDINKILSKHNIKTISLKYYDSIGFLLSLLSKITFSNYKKNFENKIKIWDSLISISKMIDIISFNFFGKSLLIVIKK